MAVQYSIWINPHRLQLRYVRYTVPSVGGSVDILMGPCTDSLVPALRLQTAVESPRLL